MVLRFTILDAHFPKALVAGTAIVGTGETQGAWFGPQDEHEGSSILGQGTSATRWTPIDVPFLCLSKNVCFVFSSRFFSSSFCLSFSPPHPPSPLHNCFVVLVLIYIYWDGQRTLLSSGCHVGCPTHQLVSAAKVFCAEGGNVKSLTVVKMPAAAHKTGFFSTLFG
jgi:hypothetical protein